MIESGFKQTTKIAKSIERDFLIWHCTIKVSSEKIARSMELAWPRLANMAIAIAMVVAKGPRKEETPADKQIFRCMTAPRIVNF